MPAKLGETPPPSRPRPPVPDHELIRPIGQGAYGEVWLARNAVGTFRAVKVVYRDTFQEAGPYEREYRGMQKFEPISRSNDGFVDILQIGRCDQHGLFYYVMELADDAAEPLNAGRRAEAGPARPTAAMPSDEIGRWANYQPKTLQDEIRRRGRLPFVECLSHALSLNLALGHLHRHGLIHRDIKPSNIIFVGGIPKLADIGLVTEVAAAQSFVGTEGFVPPEGPNSSRADIYSLGKVLYESSMGKDRMAFPEPFTALGQTAESRELEELNAVILRACAPNPRDRYQSAEEMHVDLALLQSGKSLKSKRRLERRLSLARKAAVAVAAVAAVAIAAFLYQQFQTRTARQLAKENRELAQREMSQRQRTEELLNRLELLQAENFFENDAAAKGVAHLAHVLRKRPENRVAAERILAALTQRNFPRLATKPLQHEAKLFLNAHHSVARFSPDAQRIVTISDDYSVHVWDARTGEETIRPLRHTQPVYTAEFSPDGKRLVTASDDRTAFVVEVATGELAFPPIPHGRAVLHATFSPDGRWIATGSRDETARIVRADNGGRVWGPIAQGGPVEVVAFSPDGRQLACSIKVLGRVRIWEVESSREIRSFQLEGRVDLVRFSPDGNWIAATFQRPSGDWRVQVWEARTGQPQDPLLHRNRIYALDFSPNGEHLVTASADQTARIWEVRTGEAVGQMRHASLVYSAAYSPEGNRIVTASVDHTARIWDAQTGAPLAEPMVHDGRVIHAEFSRDGSQVLTAGWEDKTAKIWNVEARSWSPRVLPHETKVRLAEFDATGREAMTATTAVLATAPKINSFNWGRTESVVLWNLATGRSNIVTGGVKGGEAVTIRFTAAGPRALFAERTAPYEFSKLARIWNVRTGTPIGEPLQTSRPITCAQFSPEGLRLATGSRNGDVIVWETMTARALLPLVSHSNSVRSVQFSPDGTKLVAADDRGRATIWDVPTGQRIAPPLSHDAEVWFAHFNCQGDKVVTGSLNFTAQIWSTNGTRLAVLPHRAPIEYAEFSPDDTKLVTASADRTACVWSVATGRRLTEPLQHGEFVWVARFSPDGLRVLTGSMDRTAQLWDVATGLKLGDAFHHDDWVTCVGFSPDGRHAMTGSSDFKTRLWNIPVASNPIPSWLPDLAETVAGQRLNEERILEPVPWTNGPSLGRNLREQAWTEPYAGLARKFSTDAH